MTDDTLLSLFTSAKNLAAFVQYAPKEKVFQVALNVYHEQAPLPLTRQSFRDLNRALLKTLAGKQSHFQIITSQPAAATAGATATDATAATQRGPQTAPRSNITDEDIAQALHDNIFKPATFNQPPPQQQMILRGSSLPVSAKSPYVNIPPGTKMLQVNHVEIVFENEHNLIDPSLMIQTDAWQKTVSLPSGFYTYAAFESALQTALRDLDFSCHLDPVTRKLTLSHATPFIVSGLFSWDHQNYHDQHTTDMPVIFQQQNHVNAALIVGNHGPPLSLTYTKQGTWFHDDLRVPIGATSLAVSFDRPVYRYLLCFNVS